MNSQLIIDVNSQSGEDRVALLEDGQLMEYRSVTRECKISVGDIYLGVVRRVMPNHNAAFVDIGAAKEGFLHYKSLGPYYHSMVQMLQHQSRDSSRRAGRGTRGRGGSAATAHEALAALGAVANGGSQAVVLSGEESSKGVRNPDQDRNGRISDYVKAGQQVLVQVIREPLSTKGASLTTEISLAGRSLVLLPFSSKVLMSSKLRSREESLRLRRILTSILPSGMGVIVRTAAEGKGVEVIHSELNGLLSRWQGCVSRLSDRPKAPCELLREITGTSALIRDNLNGTYSSIQVNDRAVHEEIQGYVASNDPQRADIVKLYTGRVPIFDSFDVTKQLKRLLGQTVPFHKGSHLVIQHPEAFHVIDVNSGSGAKHALNPEETALEVNLAACDEIARQLRLRDMGGIIVIDFIDMSKAEHRKQVYDRMRGLMSGDKVTHRILEITDFGLMQITRQRHRPEQRMDTSERCPCCAGSGRVESTLILEDEIERKLATVAERVEGPIEVRAHPFVAAYYNKGLLSRRRRVARQLGCKLTIVGDTSCNMLDYRFYDRGGNLVKL